MHVFWRRLDVEGLERLELTWADDSVRAIFTIVSVEGSGFRLDYDWRLDRHWKTQRLTVRRRDDAEDRELTIVRSGKGWTVDGATRQDLIGTDELDLSVTPFCNSIPIRKLGLDVGAELNLEIAYIDTESLSVIRSRQLYRRQYSDLLRYVGVEWSTGSKRISKLMRKGWLSAMRTCSNAFIHLDDDSVKKFPGAVRSTKHVAQVMTRIR